MRSGGEGNPALPIVAHMGILYGRPNWGRIVLGLGAVPFNKHVSPSHQLGTKTIALPFCSVHVNLNADVTVLQGHWRHLNISIERIVSASGQHARECMSYLYINLRKGLRTKYGSMKMLKARLAGSNFVFLKLE